MINIKAQKIINQKLNGLRVVGQDIDQKKVKIKEELQDLMKKN